MAHGIQAFVIGSFEERKRLVNGFSHATRAVV